MQRVRVGLTGLACVFLLVFLAAAFFGLARRDPNAPAARDAVAGSVDGNASAAEEAPKEPLAELGVTPGNLPDAPAAADPASAAPQLPAATGRPAAARP